MFSESQEETVKKVLHENTWDKYHGRSVQHFGHAYLGPGNVTATSPIPEEFSSILQTYNAALERLGLAHPQKDVLDYCPIDFDEVLQVFDGEIPKPKEQVEQEQDVDRINE